jgi:hypothetical protein
LKAERRRLRSIVFVDEVGTQVCIRWSWNEDTYLTPQGWSENDRPKPRWKELDLRLREVAQHPLLNKPSGDLE